jgi:hypothetical protein
MNRLVIIALLLLVLFILFRMGGGVRVPGETTQKEQRAIKGMSIMAEDY